MVNWKEVWHSARRYWLAIYAVIATAWALFATAFPLYISYSDHVREERKDRMAARDDIDEFMLDIREKYNIFCNRESESLRSIHKARFAEMAELAFVNTLTPPYDLPCRYITRPSGPKSLSLTVKPSHYAPSFEDWQSFIVAKQKTAMLWIEDIPIPVHVNNVDWVSIESRFIEMRKSSRDCTNRERDRAEHAFMQLECQWHIENGEVKLVRIETRSNTEN